MRRFLTCLVALASVGSAQAQTQDLSRDKYMGPAPMTKGAIETPLKSLLQSQPLARSSSGAK